MYFDVQPSNWLTGGFNGTKLRVLTHTIHSYVNKGSLGTSFHWPILTVVEKKSAFLLAKAWSFIRVPGTIRFMPGSEGRWNKGTEWSNRFRTGLSSAWQSAHCWVGWSQPPFPLRWISGTENGLNCLFWQVNNFPSLSRLRKTVATLPKILGCGWFYTNRNHCVESFSIQEIIFLQRSDYINEFRQHVS